MADFLITWLLRVTRADPTVDGDDDDDERRCYKRHT